LWVADESFELDMEFRLDTDHNVSNIPADYVCDILFMLTVSDDVNSYFISIYIYGSTALYWTLAAFLFS
jgi:hypothetical protein